MQAQRQGSYARSVRSELISVQISCRFKKENSGKDIIAGLITQRVAVRAKIHRF